MTNPPPELPVELAYERYQRGEISFEEYRRDYADPEAALRPGVPKSATARAGTAPAQPAAVALSAPMKTEGFISEGGGAAYLWIGEQRFTKAEVVFSLFSSSEAEIFPWEADAPAEEASSASRDGIPEEVHELAYDCADQFSDWFGCDHVKRERLTSEIAKVIDRAMRTLRVGNLALCAVAAERDRQILFEGWTAEHDDQHRDGELAFAASCYANHAARSDKLRAAHERQRALPENWPWGERWFKPKDRRSDLVRAAALLVAEIERLDRAAAKGDAS